jgi:hypothetical protein
VKTALRLTSTVTLRSDAGRFLPTGWTVPATCSAIGAALERGRASGLIQPRKETRTLPPLTTSAWAVPSSDRATIPPTRAKRFMGLA